MKLEKLDNTEVVKNKNIVDYSVNSRSSCENKLIWIANTLNYPIFEDKLKEHNKYKELSDKFGEAFSKAYVKILLYIDQLAQTKTRAEVSPEERQFFLDFQSMNESLGIDYQLPVFKESHEKQSIHTMADIYHHTDVLVQDPGAWFQEYINSNYGLFDTKEAIYDKNILQDRDFCKLYRM